MVRHRQYKLCYYHRQGLALFDMEADPRETRNLAADPAYQEVLGELLILLMEGWDPERIDAEIRTSQNRRSYVGEAQKAILGEAYKAGI
jgi:choline-sulfatase